MVTRPYREDVQYEENGMDQVEKLKRRINELQQKLEEAKTAYNQAAKAKREVEQEIISLKDQILVLMFEDEE